MKNNILFILHIPPPVHGAAVMGGLIKNSEKINNKFNTDFINLTTSFNLNQIGKGSRLKLLTVGKIQFRIIKSLFKKNYSLCYVSLTASGLGFYKDFLMILTLKLFRKKIIYHFHNKGVKGNSNTKIKSMMYAFVFRNTKSILLSPYLYDDIQKFVPKNDVYYCPNGIPDIKSNLKLVEATALVNTTTKFFFLSNMMKEKGVYILLEACHILKNQELNFECHFVGAWSDITEEMFNEKIEKLQIKNQVFVHGKKYGDDKIDFFLNSDIFVFPSYYDCFPLVLIEAMQYSLPIIATTTGGIPSLVTDQETGILIPERNPSKLAEVMDHLAKDTKTRNKMGKAARIAYDKKFTVNHFENRLSQIFDDVITIK